MLKIKPPTHAVDGLAVYISRFDPAWDFERINTERKAFIDRAAEAKRAGGTEAELEQRERVAAIAGAPVERYYLGATRFQPDAPDWAADGSPTTARAFLKAGEKPSEFGLRRLSHHAYQEIEEIEHPRRRLVLACRLGLRSITSDGVTWRATGDKPAGDEQMEMLHAYDPDLVTEIGAAVLNLSRPLDPLAELPR